MKFSSRKKDFKKQIHTVGRSFLKRNEMSFCLSRRRLSVAPACFSIWCVCVAGPKGAKDSLNGRARGASLATKRHLLECINKFDGPTFLLLFLLSIFICKTRPIEIENKNQKSLTCFSPKQHTRRNVRQVFLFLYCAFATCWAPKQGSY